MATFVSRRYEDRLDSLAKAGRMMRWALGLAGTCCISHCCFHRADWGKRPLGIAIHFIASPSYSAGINSGSNFAIPDKHCLVGSKLELQTEENELMQKIEAIHPSPRSSTCTRTMGETLPSQGERSCSSCRQGRRKGFRGREGPRRCPPIFAHHAQLV